jgi:hypothetical protein
MNNTARARRAAGHGGWHDDPDHAFAVRRDSITAD